MVLAHIKVDNFIG